MRRRVPVSKPVLVLLVTGVAVGLAGPAAAGPPSTGTVVRTAPYDSASAYDFTSCTTGATCTSEPTADAGTGVSSASSAFQRDQAATGHESVTSVGQQAVRLKLPPKATTVRATLRWQVDRATAEAVATAGVVHADAGVVAFLPGCSGACSTRADSSQVVHAASSRGVPAQTASGAREVVLVLEASGDLPHFLDVVTYAYARTNAGRSRLCLSEDSCTTLQEEHAGRSASSIGAALTSVTVTVG